MSVRRQAGALASASVEVRAHQSIIISFRQITVHSETKIAAANQGRRFAQNSRFWRMAMRREAVDHENFFIAKNRDSESARQAFGGPRSAAVTSTALHSFSE